MHFTKTSDMNIKKVSILFLMLFSIVVEHISAQSKYTFEDSAVIERIKTDIEILSSEEMEGREAGTPGEMKAAYYIKSRMKEIGLKPVFDKSYLQEFEFLSGYVYNDSSFIKIGGQRFSPYNDFYILSNSADATITAEAIYVNSGLEIPELINDFEDVDDVKGKILFIEYYSHPENQKQVDFDVSSLLKMKISTAVRKGAAGIVFVNTHGVFEDPEIRNEANVAREAIPVVFARSEVFELFEQNEMYGNITLSTELIKKSYTAVNVAGYLDNNAPLTIVIGGHFDHLGYGGPTSRDLKQNVIHYGADDNASGTAGVLESARYYSSSTSKDYNFLFIAFSAEEKGLIGSKYFSESEVYDLGKINFMFNFDMIGRMQNNRLILIGTGTSLLWDTIIDSNKPQNFNISKGKSGVGGSDHSSFYRKNIPVIFFHTGTHEDYHASTDTPDKINYPQTVEILNYAYEMIDFTASLDKLTFTETPVSESRRRRGDSVSLGIMPDHAYEGKGVKIMALVENRPAEKAGLKVADIIIGIEDKEINEIHSYMKVLEELKKGQTVSVLIVRDEVKLVVALEL